MREFHTRSIVKAISWRALASIATIAIVYAFTRRAALSLGVGGVEVALKVFLYYFHERLWQLIVWGRPPHPLSGLDVTRKLDADHLEEIRKKLGELGYL